MRILVNAVTNLLRRRPPVKAAVSVPDVRRCVCGEPLLSWEPPYCSGRGTTYVGPADGGRLVDLPDCRAKVAAGHTVSGLPVPPQEVLDVGGSWFEWMASR